MAEERQTVVFKLAQEEYGLPIEQVREINRLTEITKLPQTPSFVEGVVNLRGNLIPIMDLRKRFGIPVHNTDETRVMVVDVINQTVGIIVDRVMEVLNLSTTDIEPPPASCVMDAACVDGIGKIGNRLVILLKIEKIVSSGAKHGHKLSLA